MQRPTRADWDRARSPKRRSTDEQKGPDALSPLALRHLRRRPPCNRVATVAAPSLERNDPYAREPNEEEAPMIDKRRMRDNIYTNDGGKTWGFRVRRADGRYDHFRPVWTTRKAAKQARTEVMAQRNRGSYVAPSRQTFAAFAADWIAGQKTQLRPSTWESYERNLRIHVTPKIGDLVLQDLQAQTLDKLYVELSDAGLSARTVRYIATIIHKALKDATRKNLVMTNVADRADPPKATISAEKQLRTWTGDELESFLASIEGERLYPVFLVAATTGMRRGEVLGLRWQDVDLDAARASIRQTIICVAHEVVFSEPKTHKGRRTVPLASQTVAALKAHRAQQTSEKLAIGPGNYHDHDLVFAAADGAPLDPESVSLVFDRRVRKSGLPRIRLHDLRHTWATLALQAGVPVKVVSEILGHASVSITYDVYSHVIPSMAEDAAAKVAALVFGGKR